MIDYPLYDTQGQKMLDRADRLMSGEYLTNFAGTVYQFCRFFQINRFYKTYTVRNLIISSKSTGDDGATLLDRQAIVEIMQNKYNKKIQVQKDLSPIELYQKVKNGEVDNVAYCGYFLISEYYKNVTRDEVHLGKSDCGVIHYNRRYFILGAFPAPNLFTYINMIYRREDAEFERTVKTMNDRMYDIYTAYVCFLVIYRLIAKGQNVDQILKDDIQNRTGYDMDKLHFKDTLTKYQSIRGDEFPLVQDLKYELKKHDLSPSFEKLYGFSVIKMIERYATSPFIDTSVIQINPQPRRIFTIDMKLYDDEYFKMMQDVPY
jgi:hypothetical protein